MITARTEAGLAEIGRHRLSTPGTPRIDDAHCPTHPATGSGPRPPRLLGCAHPLRPLALADLIGLDTVNAIGESLYEIQCAACPLRPSRVPLAASVHV